MERLEWELIPLVRDEDRDLIHDLAIEVLALDFALASRQEGLSRPQQDQLLTLQSRMGNCVQTPCEAAGAPYLCDRISFLEDASEAYHELGPEPGLSFEEFVHMARTQRDCAGCPGACAYPGVTGVPCDFDLTPILSIVPDLSIRKCLSFELIPEDMYDLAERLENRVTRRGYQPHPEVNSLEYLEHVIRFLRFWARKGFGVAPAYTDIAEG